MVVYPYAKRFTDYPHAVLALAQAVAPVGAWIAVTGHWSWHAVVLGVGVGLWIGGFDLVYACQDTESDREQGVRSFPARWGNRAALRTARVVHAVVFALFVWFGVLEGFGPIWYAGLALTAAAFAYQHAIVGPDDLRRVNRSFFTANGFVGLALGAAGRWTWSFGELAAQGARGSSGSAAPAGRPTPQRSCAACSRPASRST